MILLKKFTYIYSYKDQEFIVSSIRGLETHWESVAQIWVVSIYIFFLGIYARDTLSDKFGERKTYVSYPILYGTKITKNGSRLLGHTVQQYWTIPGMGSQHL